MKPRHLLLALFATPCLQAATITWTGEGTDNNFGTLTNWVDPNTSNPPAAIDPGNSFTFAGSTRLAPNNEAARIGADNSITFAAGAGSFNVGGNALRAGNIANNSSVEQTISLSLRYNGTRTINTGAAGINLTNIPLSTSSTSSRTVDKTGSGTLTLSGSGGARILFNATAGTLAVTGNLATTISATIASGATLSGTGTIGGNLIFNSGAILNVNLLDPLAVTGTATFTDLSFANITGWDAANAADGNYTLVEGISSLTLAGSTPTLTNPHQFSATKFGYFRSGSLEAVIYTVPEPAFALLGSFGLLGLLRRRR
ncbi:MAG: hypothetical protein MUF31_14935 [Akkermansiaceae bacterium]|jgi:hypothetical protein|nr:hypothetical protein [Akkermansiaceae bacterium]